MSHNFQNKIAIIITKWNPEFVGACLGWCKSILLWKWLLESNIDVITVPGWVEIPLVAKKLAKSLNYNAIIGIAFICENPIYRYEFVAQSVVDSIIKLNCEVEIPILSAVLSPVTFNKENKEEVSFYKEHMITKWEEVANSCLDIIKVHDSI